MNKLLWNLSDEQLNSMPEVIEAEWTRRIKSRLERQGPGTRCISIRPGFGGLAGVTCEFICFATHGPKDTPVVNFGRQGRVMWSVDEHTLGSYIRIIDQG
jgi:hypothetical protein